MGAANERRRYNVTSSLIGWRHTFTMICGKPLSITCPIKILIIAVINPLSAVSKSLYLQLT